MWLRNIDQETIKSTDTASDDIFDLLANPENESGNINQIEHLPRFHSKIGDRGDKQGNRIHQ